MKKEISICKLSIYGAKGVVEHNFPKSLSFRSNKCAPRAKWYTQAKRIIMFGGSFVVFLYSVLHEVDSQDTASFLLRDKTQNWVKQVWRKNTKIRLFPEVEIEQTNNQIRSIVNYWSQLLQSTTIALEKRNKSKQVLYQFWASRQTEKKVLSSTLWESLGQSLHSSKGFSAITKIINETSFGVLNA